VPRKASIVLALPRDVEQALMALGERLMFARKRRKETLASFAERLSISVPTLMKMERGNPTVSIAVYATALWAFGRIKSLPEIVDPLLDDKAIELEIARIKKRR